MKSPSMNWREIDQVLTELRLPGAFIRDVAQTDAATLLFALHRPGDRQRGIGPARITLLCSFAAGASRLHRTTAPFPARRVPTPRFVSFLRAHLGNGRIDSALQLATERIVRIRCGAGARRRIVWFRLWSGASNCLVTDERGIILDALFRRPQRSEVAGGRFDPCAGLALGRAPTARGADPDRYQLRHLDGDGDYNARLDAHYRARERIEQGMRDAHTARLRFEGERQRIATRIVRLRAALNRATGYETLRAAGQTILANAHLIDRAATRLAAPDGGDPIPLFPGWSPADNARRYFLEYRRQRAAVERLQTELAEMRSRWEVFRAQGHGPFLEAVAAASTPAPRRPSRAAALGPGSRYHSAGWVLCVGRSASANDAILRHAARGNDYWFHCRDHPGAHVFLTAQRGKSPPLAVLLDAAALAAFFSKARRNGQADVHYTQVKHLRRVKGGAPGAVLPLREKNLFVRLDQARLRRLLGSRDAGGDPGPQQPGPPP